MKVIETLFETYKDAVFQKNIEAFASIYDEKVMVFDMWGRWTYEGLVTWREMAKSWFASLGTEKDVVAFDNIQILATGKLAFASAFVRFTAMSEKGEQLRYLENRLTWVVRKNGDGWKIIHQHSSGPVDFETMKVILKR